MNFIGHAHVALWTSRSPGFVLGAMLPDFASMAGARLGPVEQPEVSAGVSVELLIDGELVRGREVGDAYLSALAAFAELAGSAQEPRFQRLAQRLLQHGIPYDYERPELVATRLASILARRPRLALSAEATRVVGSIMPDLKVCVQQRLPELFLVLRDGLSHRRYSSGITG